MLRQSSISNTESDNLFESPYILKYFMKNEVCTESRYSGETGEIGLKHNSTLSKDTRFIRSSAFLPEGNTPINP